MNLKELHGRDVRITDRELLRRRMDNREYMMSLTNDNLLMNFRMEAGLFVSVAMPENAHGGWESPTCQLRGHFLGHWLSAAAMLYHATGDMEIRSKADAIITELARCQQENGGEWVGSIPEKYLYWIAKGKGIWAPQYTLHKTFMGLLDMYELAGNETALCIARNWSRWFLSWSEKFTREEFDKILDIETGGMLEIWAQLYGITKDDMYVRLIDIYYRGRLFDRLLRGEDALTNMHANTTIPEVLGAAKAYEVTGDKKWLDIVTAYWNCAVTDRGQYATGGQTCGEVWTPKYSMAERLGEKNQEHCTVYNMMRLATFLFTQTGEAKYADYFEQNLYNGIMAQGYWKGNYTHGNTSDNPDEGLLTYFLPLHAGGRKAWSSRTQDFFCCHGTLVQANAANNGGLYFQSDNALYICQFFDSAVEFIVGGTKVSITQTIDTLTGSQHNSSSSPVGQSINDTTVTVEHDPNLLCARFAINAEQGAEFEICLRIPWWAKSGFVLKVNGEQINAEKQTSGFVTIKRAWSTGDVIELEIKKEIICYPLHGGDMVAFLDGPVVLAGLCDGEKTLYADEKGPEAIIVGDNEREWSSWMHTFKTKGQDTNIRFIPLHRVGYERYTVYFPVVKK